jgi:hypothetical protein
VTRTGNTNGFDARWEGHALLVHDYVHTDYIRDRLGSGFKTVFMLTFLPAFQIEIEGGTKVGKVTSFVDKHRCSVADVHPEIRK